MPINMPPLIGGASRCGQCKWYGFPIKGKTCRETREVEINTPACVEFQVAKTRPFEPIERDKYVQDIERNIEVFTKDYLKQFAEELKTYHLFDHKKKDARSYMSEEEMLGLAARFETCQAYTDRVVEIKNEIREQYGKLQGLLKDCQGYLFSHHTDVVRSLKNDKERDVFYRAVLPRLCQAIDRLEAVLDKADLAHVNLKDTHFSMCKTQDAAIEIWKTRVQGLDAHRRAHV